MCVRNIENIEKIKFLNVMNKSRLASTIAFTLLKAGQASKFSKTSPITKAARNISDFTPLQQFQKNFLEVEKLLLKLRQASPPSDFQQLFEDFSEIKSKYLIFVESVNKISRHVKLGNNPKKISEKPYEICAAFPGEISRFFSYFIHVKSKLSTFFINAFQNFFSIMEESFQDYGNLCLREQQTRYIYLQYESTIQDLFSSIRKGLNSILPNFNEIQDVSSLVEIMKMLSRKYESELPHALHNQRLMLNAGSEQLTNFHNSFVALVPMLVNIPNFNQLFNDISELIDPIHELISCVLLEIKLESPPILTSQEIQESVISEDLFHITPKDHLIKEMAALFGASDGSNIQPIEWYDEILSKARGKITNLEQKNHQLQTKLKSYDQIKSEKVLNERIEENRRFKERIIQEYNEKRIELMRDVINSIKILVPYDLLASSDDFDTQLKCIISNAELEQKVTKDNLNDAKETIAQTREILCNFLKNKFYMKVDKDTPLTNLAEISVKKFQKQQKKMEQTVSNAGPTNSDLHAYLKKFLSKRKINVSKLTTVQLKKEMKKYTSNLEYKLNETEEKNRNLLTSSSDFEDRVIENLSKVQRALASYNKKEPLVADVNFEMLTENILDLLNESETNFQKLLGFRKFLTSFLAQMLYALRLQQPKFKDITDEQLKDVMTTILDSPQIQRNLMSSSPSSTATSALNIPTISTPQINSNISNSVSNINETPKTLRSIQSGRIPTQRPQSLNKDYDVQFTLRMHAYLSDCCAQLKGVTPVQFIHTPIEKIMQDITKTIYENNENLLNYKGLVADIYLRLVNNRKNSKEALMKASIGDIAHGIFSSLEELIKSNERNITERIETIVNMIHDEDKKQFSAMKLKPLQMIHAEIEKLQKTNDVILPIVQILEEIEKDLDKSRIGFVPVSPHFKHYLESIEKLRRETIRLTEHETQPTVYLITNRMIPLIDGFSNALSALATNEILNDSQMNAFDAIIQRKELDDQIQKLQRQIKEKNNEINRIRDAFNSYLEANKKKCDDQIHMLSEIHQNEISQIIEFYEKKQIF
ncbi:hypothetical protein TRFO_40475 [Tritrichomonas foetus]|uniref:Uncharacterized protein n=1 Tax=Tritrichomonas foetus TaxID=1144522 RepID=A0A1J4J723_9EUKA|nr:hypothetical protein TRFO_40475 [Tritrichomonas foetus]|eukprot:OHS93237.1 hypothetical protein TRFO_40475 [Tritrichomonas foetus]